MKYTTVVFDWDGTLMDSTWSIVSAIQNTAKVMNLTVPSVQKARWVIGLSFEEALPVVVPELKSEQIHEFVEHYKQFYMKHRADVHLFEGIEPLLEELKAKGVHLAIATGKSRVGLNQALEYHKLQSFFEVTKTADQTESKPSPLMLEEIMQELMVTPEEVVMVGDTSHDVEMARNAGCDSIAVLYGAHSETDIFLSHPTKIAGTVEDLRRLLAIYCIEKSA